MRQLTAHTAVTLYTAIIRSTCLDRLSAPCVAASLTFEKFKLSYSSNGSWDFYHNNSSSVVRTAQGAFDRLFFISIPFLVQLQDKQEGKTSGVDLRQSTPPVGDAVFIAVLLYKIPRPNLSGPCPASES